MNEVINEKNTTSILSLDIESRKALKKAIMEISDSLTRISAEKDLQKDILDEMNDKYGIDKKLIRFLAKTYFDSSIQDVREWNEKFEEAYERVVEQPL